MERKARTQGNFGVNKKTQRILEDSSSDDSDNDKNNLKTKKNPVGIDNIPHFGDDSDDDDMMLIGANKQ